MDQAKNFQFTGYQKFVVGSLAFLQFTLILDFMVLSPLGAILMPALNITPAQFGLVVSAYAFSAGASGILAAGFLDRFDRKRTLLLFYGGFILGTFLCAVAPSFPFLLAARTVTGLFGGVIGSIIYAITTDLFPYSVRGRVMGVMQTAFGASQVLGIPLALFLANRWSWHSPFYLIVGASLAALVLLAIYLQPINSHLAHHTGRSAVAHLLHTCTSPRYVQAFATTALLATGGFMLMPFASAFTVNNVGIALDRLPWIYLVTGISTILIGPAIGRMSDTVGQFKTFVAGSILSIVMVNIYTHLGFAPLWGMILVNVILFVGIFSRMIPSQAMMSAIPTPGDRGAFMAVGSAIQQLSGGIASILAGLIVVQSVSGKLQNFDLVGYVVTSATLFTIVMMYTIHRRIQSEMPTHSQTHKTGTH